MLWASPPEDQLQVPRWQVPRWWPSSGIGLMGLMHINKLGGKAQATFRQVHQAHPVLSEECGVEYINHVLPEDIGMQ